MNFHSSISSDRPCYSFPLALSCTILLLTLLTLGIVFLPLLKPGLDTVEVALHLVRGIASKLDHHLWCVRIPRLLQQHLHDLRVQVLLQLRLGVFPWGGVSAGKLNTNTIETQG